MPAVRQETEIRRRELKRELYKLLLEHSDGILKINVWSILTKRTNINLVNSEFQVGSLDGLFKLYQDMIHEEHRDGKTYICLNQHFSWESNTQLQQRGLRISAANKSLQQSSLATPPKPVIGNPTKTLDPVFWPKLNAPIQQTSHMASDSFLAQQINMAAKGLRMPGFRTQGPVPLLPPAPTLVQYPSPVASTSGYGTNVSSQPVESDDDTDSSESEDEVPTSGGRVSKSLVKMRVVDILMLTGPLRIGQLRTKYKQKYHAKIQEHAGCSLLKLSEMFPDAIERFLQNPNDKRKKIRVKDSYIKLKYPEQKWGQGLMTGHNVKSEGKPQVVDLTKDSVIDLTADSNFISLEINSPGPSTSSQTKTQHIIHDQKPPVDINPPAPFETVHVIGKPLNKKKFEEKELNVAPIRRANRFARPTPDQLENAAQECIEIIAESNSYVSQERIEKLLLQRFQVRNMYDLHVGLRYVDQIGCVNEHNRLLAKINAYVQGFVKVRCICTLYELKECLKEYAPGKTDFTKLNMGPLQRFPIVYQMFKFPTDFEEIPEITTLDVLEHLRNYLTKKNKWTERADLKDFMEYLVEEYDADDAFQLGVRIRSLALGIQVLKKAQRDTGRTIRNVSDGFKEQLRLDIETVFQKFRTTVVHTTSDGTWEVRNHYLKLRPEMAIQEIFQKFNLIMSLDEPDSKAQKKHHRKIESAISNFLESVRNDVLARNLFHLAICVSNSVLEESAMDILSPPDKDNSIVENREEKVKPAKGTIVNSLKKYLEKCLQHGTLTLSLLDKIEEKIAEESKYPSFAEIGHGRFLEFVLEEAKGLLDEFGGTSLGSGSRGADTESGYKPTHVDVLSFIHQCIQCGRESEEEIEAAMCNQFNVKAVKQLGYGKTSNLITLANKPGQHQYQEHSVVFEVAAGTDLRKSQESRMGMLGHQTKEAALACLHNCPLLEDMSVWSHWPLVFEPELGKLKDFIQKYGGSNTIPIEGGKKLFTYHIAAMETKPGILLKLTSHTSTEQFEEALNQKNPRNVCGQLMSLIVANKGIKNSPLALLANQMKSHLFTMHARDNSDHLPGAPPSEDRTDEAVKFILQCLVILPVKSCVSLANQIFLEPLGQVVGSSKSKFLLLSACEMADETNRLQELGCMLGIGEWTNQIQQKCQVMMSDVEIVPDEEAEMIILDDDDDLGNDEDSDTTSVTSSLSSILSDDDDDDVQIISVEKEPELKKEIQKDESAVELSTGDEDTQTESNNVTNEEFKVIDELEQDEIEKETQSPDVSQETEKKKEAEEDDISKEKEMSVEEDDSDIEIMTDEEKKLKDCEKIVNNIRREEFGIGIELNEDGQRLKKVQDERLGRSLDRLSKDLYSKDTHFVLELIQNADDNDYPESLIQTGQFAAVKFVMQTDGVIVLNNESGFVEKNIRALCDVGRSTKGKHKFGYIGQKGIGFKSVFRVTDRPEVHSNGYHICFDVQSGPMGYILPHWIEDIWEVGEGWTTKIVLPLKEEMKVHMRSLAARFNDIHPSLLLFLHRLREITIDNKVENSSQVMRRKDLGDGVIEIEHNNGIDRWLVVKKMLDASKISLQAKSGVEVESTEIALAFPLSDQTILSKVMPPKQPVFAFLPLRSYGFRFIIQADFDVPSSREDVDRDSAWNQWIRNEIHKLFIEALDVFKNHREFSGMKALIAFLQFIPVEDEILDFFRPVSTQILKQFRAKPCLPTQPNYRGVVSWKLPTQVVTVKDSLVREVVTPDFLQKHLDLYYLHREVAEMLNPTLIQCLGIESLTTNHLIQIGQALTVSFSRTEMDTGNKIILLAKWLACIYRSLDEFVDNQEVYNTLIKMKIIPLASKEFVSLEDSTVFFPLYGDQRARSQYRDPVTLLQEDMNTIHPLFLSVPDNEVNSQVQKLLVKLNVRTLSPHDVINHHILPILKSDIWKTKKREVLISYLIYIKEQSEKDSSLVNMDELANVAVVMTNQGEKNPKRDNVHFTSMYGNRYNLTQTFPGYDWCLIDSVYIQNVMNNADKLRWHKFFSRLGVTDFLTIRNVQVELDSESVKESPWAPVAQMSPEDFSNGCIIDDYSCDEIRDLLKFNKVPQTYELQMKSLCEHLDQFWDSQFAKYTNTKLIRKGSNQEREVESSLIIWLKNLDWLPAIKAKAEMQSDGIVKYTEEILRMTPSTLYYPFDEIVNLLSYTVTYVDVQFNTQKSTFAKFLGLKFEVTLESLLESLKKWGARLDSNTPSVFVTSHRHIQNFYQYLSDNLSRKQIQDLFDKEPVIFVPVQIKGFDYGEMVTKGRFPVDVAGQMLCRNEVWWEDKTGLFVKYNNILIDIHADIGKKKILSSYQKFASSPTLHELFKMGRIQMSPEVEEYAELLVHVASSQSRVEQDTLKDVMKILSIIGDQMYIHENDPEFETRKLLMESKKKKILNIFKGQNIFPTKKRTWTSLESNPIIADNKEYEQIFQNNDKVHIVLLEENIQQRRQNPQSGGSRCTINWDAVMHVLRICEIEDLSAVVEEEIITEMYTPCARLQNYMLQCVPLLQIFLYSNYTSVYQSLIANGMATTLSKLQCIETNKLEVKYWFRNDPDIYAIRPEKCTLKDDQFIFHKEAVESYGEINKVIARVFSNNDSSCFRELRNFLTDVHSCITGQSHESIDECLARYNAVSVADSEEKWTVPAPVLPEPEPFVVEEDEPVVEEIPEEIITIEEESENKEKEPTAMKAWPPMSDATERNLFPRQKMKRDDQESKVWPPPRAPDYMKSVKDLPSGMKVVHNEGQGEDKGPSDYSTHIYMRHESENRGLNALNESEKKGEPTQVDRPHIRPLMEIEVTPYPAPDRRSSIPFIEYDHKSVPQGQGYDSVPYTYNENRSSASHDQSFDGITDPEHVGRPLSHQGQHHENAPYQEGDKAHGSGYRGENTPRQSDNNQPNATDGVTGGKRRHISGGSDSQSQPSAKRPALRLGLPIWEKELGEYEEEELACGDNLKLPTGMMFDSSRSSEMPEIGRWGELTVYQYLLKEMDKNTNITFVNWCNEDEELGQPYDFEVGVVTEEESFTVYIEVKSTLSDTKEIFEISYPQIKFAHEHKNRFHVYRIFNASNSDKVRLVRIQNLAEKIDKKYVRLCLWI